MPKNKSTISKQVPNLQVPIGICNLFIVICLEIVFCNLEIIL